MMPGEIPIQMMILNLLGLRLSGTTTEYFFQHLLDGLETKPRFSH
ncbi:hypothetical protein Q427_31750 [Halomonas sp. BC04]|nr:hypothetical protein Q427_31750 [Halomonas sp. BC04]